MYSATNDLVDYSEVGAFVAGLFIWNESKKSEGENVLQTGS
jgi:hypothetical protein